MSTESAGAGKIVRTAARVVIASVLVFIVGLYFIAFFMNKKSQFPSIDLETEDIAWTITRTDGTSESYDADHFPVFDYGETLTCSIRPIGDAGEIQNGTLAFSLYHCYVTVWCGDELIYEQSEPEEGQLIGHRYYIIPLPEGYESRTITIQAVCSEHDSVTSIGNLRILPSDRTAYAFRTGQFATGVLLITLLISSIFMIISSLLTYIRERHSNGLGSISLLCASICLWYMGFSGDMQPLVESTTFLAAVEYVGLYLAPMALSFFIQNHTTSRRLHRFCRALTAVLAGFFVFASVVTLFVPGISYVDYIKVLQMLFLFTMIVLFAEEIRERGAKRDIGENILHKGVAFAIILGILEIVRYLLAEQISQIFPLIANSMMPLCILALAFTMLMYYGVRITENQYRRMEQESLRKLAFIDQLTGAPNRAACYQRIDEMKKNHATDYVVTFIDLNFLKKTNDTWGHEKGDELIQTAGDLLKTHFTGDDFFGRWGGDEFIAVHFGTLDETKAIMDDIQREIDAMNTFGRHDFTLSESWGFGESTKDAPIGPEEAIRRADEQMYAAKQKVHAARK